MPVADDAGPPQRVVNGEDLVPGSWGDGKVETVEEWGHRQFMSGLKTGREQGLKFAVDTVMDHATAAFSKGIDDRAIILRGEAKTLQDLKA